ncbi:MAG: HNH endonuclease [Saprospiraceae bacterium]|nr:HNH endonuclease [Saprospiraceae bacterium]
MPIDPAGVAASFNSVHHLVSVFDIGEEYEVNPISDLRPVCPNCHAMLHRPEAPLSIEELKGILKRR